MMKTSIRPSLLLLPFLIAPCAFAQEGPKTNDPAPEEEAEEEEELDVSLEAVKPREVQVHWKPDESATGYELWRKLEAEPWKKLASLPKSARSYVDKTLSPRVRCSYKVANRIGDDRLERAPVGPIEALDDFYLELKSVRGVRAVVRIHIWDLDLREWVHSAGGFNARIGKEIGAEDVDHDFRTGAKVIKLGTDETDKKLKFLRYLTKDRRLLRVTTADRPPEAVLPPQERKKKKKKKKKKAKKKIASKEKLPPPTTGETSRPTLKFPQPKVVGQLKGTKIKWEIVNHSRHRMMFVISGKISRRTFKIGPEQTYVTHLKRGGTYEVTVNSSNNKVVPLQGKFGLLPGTHYRTEFGIRSVSRRKP